MLTHGWAFVQIGGKRIYSSPESRQAHLAQQELSHGRMTQWICHRLHWTNWKRGTTVMTMGWGPQLAQQTRTLDATWRLHLQSGCKFERESRDCQESVPKHSGIHCSTSSPHCIWSARRPVLHSRRAGTASQTILFYIRSPTPYHQTTKHVTTSNILEPVNDAADFARITAAQVMVMNLEEWRSKNDGLESIGIIVLLDRLCVLRQRAKPKAEKQERDVIARPTSSDPTWRIMPWRLSFEAQA